MKQSYTIAYYVVWFIALFTALLALYINFSEVYYLAAHTSMMSQLTKLSDNAAMGYCFVGGVYYLVFLSIFLRYDYLKKHKQAAITAAIIFVSFVIQLILVKLSK